MDVTNTNRFEGVEAIEHLDADNLHKDLLSRSLEDHRLRPLLPLLGVTSPDPKAQHEGLTKDVLTPSIRILETKAFTFPNAPHESLPLEDWEVQELLGDKPFKNWVALTHFTPKYTLIARSIRGVQSVVKYAGLVDRKVRVVGYRHTWSPLFTKPEDIVLTFIPPNVCEELPYSDPPSDWHSELQGVTLVESVDGVKPPSDHVFAKVMAGTTNNQFRLWCHKHANWALPFNTVVLAVTFGGTNSTICHGAGLSTSTLSDLVKEIEYVDAHGNLQRVSDPEELKAASGCFGFLGIVVSITIQMETMTIAEMRPTQVPVVLAIPPPKGYPIPQIIRNQMRQANISEEDIENARLEWIRRCEEDHFHEWFWFPYQKNAWVNTWKRRLKTPEDSTLPQWPQFGLKNIDEMDAHGAFGTAVAKYDWLPPSQQAYAFGLASLASLPNISEGQPSMTAYISEGLHFRGGTQTFPFWGMEWELPVRHLNGKRDYGAIQRAWWDGISAIYSRPEAPCRAALEMRLTGGSDVLLAPQRGNQSTASIEVFTHPITPPDEWRAFRQLVVDRWTSYKDETGAYFNARPHWAKHWWDLEVHGKPIQQHVKEVAYKQAFTEFREVHAQILSRRGTTVAETRRRFDMELMGRLIFE